MHQATRRTVGSASISTRQPGRWAATSVLSPRMMAVAVPRSRSRLRCQADAAAPAHFHVHVPASHSHTHFAAETPMPPDSYGDREFHSLEALALETERSLQVVDAQLRKLEGLLDTTQEKLAAAESKEPRDDREVEYLRKDKLNLQQEKHDLLQKEHDLRQKELILLNRSPSQNPPSGSPTSQVCSFSPHIFPFSASSRRCCSLFNEKRLPSSHTLFVVFSSPQPPNFWRVCSTVPSQ